MKYLRLISAFIVFAAFLGVVHPNWVFAAEKGLREVKAGVFNFEGYHTLNGAGRLEGYGIDLLKLLGEYSDLNFVFTGYDKSWQEMQEMLQNGEIDVVSSARRSPEREEIFAFSLPVGRNHTVLSKQIYNTRLRAGDYSSYNGMKVGAIAGSSQNKNLKEFAKDKGFAYALIEYESPEDLSKALQKGDVDAILSSNLRKPHNETLLDIIKSDNFYMIARKEDQALIDEINYAIEQMNLNEGDWQNNLYYKHYGPEETKIPEYSTREQNFIASVRNSDRKITAIGRMDMAPYSYVENDELKGILPDFFVRVMEQAGLPYKLIAPENQDEYAQKMLEGEAEIALDSLLPALNGENEVLEGFVTEPYLVTGLARVTKNDFKGRAHIVAIPDNMTIDLIPETLKNVSFKRYPSSQQAMRAVQRGEVDAAYVLPLTAQRFVNREPGAALVYSIMDDGGASFRMFVPADVEHELITILKKAIKGMPPGSLNQISSNYIAYNADEMSLLHYLYANPEIMLGGSFILMIGTSLLIIMWLKGRWNKRMLAATEHANHELEGQLAIVEALSRDYSNVLSINGATGKASMIKISEQGAVARPEQLEEEENYDELLKNYVKHKVHPEDRKYVARALELEQVRQVLAEKNEYSGTYRTLDHGKIQYFQFTFVRPQETDSRDENMFLGGIRNIDEVIRREQKQKKELAEALAQARYASAAKTAFLNNMSHDIRTPMNAIIGFATLAATNADNSGMVKRYLGKIRTSGNHLLSLINDVLDMSRIESGKVKIEEQEARLPEILHDLRTIVQADVRAKQLDFQIDTLNVINEVIFCDKLHLNQVLLNILSNAIKYTYSGGKVSARVVQKTEEANGKATFEFRVKDTGIGMSKEFLEHVFEPFEREQTTTVSGIQGTGLGLAITKKIVDLMGGHIEVQSEPQKGSEFIVTFNFRVLDETNDEKLPECLEGGTALIVDDDIDTCTSLGKMLSTLGMRPNWTTLGKEALVRAQFAKEQNEAYGAFLIDWRMADMNGIELARQLRKIAPAETPIILITAYDWTDIEEEGREAGVTAFCSKPVFLSELRKILTNPLSESRDEIDEPHGSELFEGKRILLAEDNEMNQEIAQMILENVGFTLDIAENGQEAVDKMLENPANYYDLILMDVQMPIMNGYDATCAIRNLDDPVKAEIPIIAMTANAFDEDREEAIKSGMNGYVAKPIDIKKMMETLEETLKKGQYQ